MKLKELREQIEFEFDAMHSVIAELNLLRVELAERVPTVRE